MLGWRREMGTGGLKPSAESISEFDRLIGTRGVNPRPPLQTCSCPVPVGVDTATRCETKTSYRC
jgi:hypothetical protein